MLRIGLTGGIGSGKSTAAKYFAKLNIPIIDADKITHELLEPNTIVYKKIIAHFGEIILTTKKTIDRKKLGQLVFRNKKERLWIEKIIHPRVSIEMTKRAKSLKDPYCIMAIPLLLETKFSPKVDRVLVIDCTKTRQIKHTRERNLYTIKHIKDIIASQIDRHKRIKRANDVIYNSGALSDLKNAVKKLHNYYLSLV
jgi:dephospho-CoA kinase